MTLANHIATVFLGILVVSVTDALVATLVHHQTLDVLIVVAMEISIVAFLDHVMPRLVVVSFVLIIPRVTSASYVNWDILGMLLIKTVSFVIVILVQLAQFVTGIVVNARA